MLLVTAAVAQGPRVPQTVVPAAPSAKYNDGLQQWLEYVEPRASDDALDDRKELSAELTRASQSIERWCANLGTFNGVQSYEEALATTRRLLGVKKRVDGWLADALARRTKLAARKDEPNAKDRVRRYLRATSVLIDLSGRLRYSQHDMLNNFAVRWADTPQRQAQLLDLLIEYRSTVGAGVAAVYLQPTAPAAPAPGPLRQRAAAATSTRASDSTREKVLQLIVAAQATALLPNVVQVLNEENLSAGMLLATAETIRKLGLPQEPRADTPKDLPKPAITPNQLQVRLATLGTRQLTASQYQRYEALKTWLDERVARGVTESTFKVAGYELQPGDWLLMRNPSPYNLFTDLSPGLFTHVGVVTLERGDDGIARMVIVDMPERGETMPATNVEVYLERTLHHAFLRHPDAKVAEAMGQAANDVIGSQVEFDLNFRTERVTELRQTPLKGRKIQTYCAGLLLLCALQSTEPREAFFPFSEGAAGGKTQENLKKLGMSIGEDFISPTGAFFSTKLSLVGSREPMYDPAREIEEGIFDHFAQQMDTQAIRPTLDLFDTLRLKVAQASSGNSTLTQALARAVGVSADMDLVAAAKAAAVVETLDEVAFGSSAEYSKAREAIRSGSVETARRRGATESQLAATRTYRQRHAELAGKWDRQELSPRELRMALVEYYARSGKQRLDQLYFSTEPTPTK
ncbi:MAG: hypothetical protein JSS27_16325 [Planctomycetes bacterium]|nr:hypothetical protein [Planctomycetota bacterium]